MAYTWDNKLDVDGSITDHTGWTLQVQTNSLSTGVSTNWVNVPDSETINQVAWPIDTANGSVFFRLILP